MQNKLLASSFEFIMMKTRPPFNDDAWSWPRSGQDIFQFLALDHWSFFSLQRSNSNVMTLMGFLLCLKRPWSLLLINSKLVNGSFVFAQDIVSLVDSTYWTIIQKERRKISSSIFWWVGAIWFYTIIISMPWINFEFVIDYIKEG